MPEANAGALASATERMMEAALVGDGWRESLGRLAEAAGAQGAVLVTETRSGKQTALASAEVAEPVADYLAGKAPPDPRTSRVWPSLSGGFVTDFETFSRDEIRRNPFYADFLHPIGFGWHACAALNEWPGDNEIFLSFKRELRSGHYERSEIAIIDSVLPALRTVTNIAHARFNAETDGYTQALGASGEAIFECDAAGRMLRTNEAAQQLLTSDLSLSNGRLFARNQADQQKLSRARSAALERPARTGFAILPASSPPRRLLVRCLPVLGNARDLFCAASALMIVETWDPLTAPLPQSVAALSEAFGLTRMEARVASLVAAGVSPLVAARILSISEGTSRNHLKAAMAKAGVGRQAELAAIATRLVF